MFRRYHLFLSGCSTCTGAAVLQHAFKGGSVVVLLHAEVVCTGIVLSLWSTALQVLLLVYSVLAL